jgi:transcriptional regulator with XRE-family HTH domain
MEKMAFQAWLKRERKRANLTQEELGERAGLGRTYVNKIERQRVDVPTYETRQKLHKVLGTSEDVDLSRNANLQIGTTTATAGAHPPTVEVRDAHGTITAAAVTALGGRFVLRDGRLTVEWGPAMRWLLGVG